MRLNAKIFLFFLLSFVFLSFAQAEDKRATILLLDFNDPHEIDIWVDVLGLQSKNCPQEIDLCNNEFIAMRPLQNPKLNLSDHGSVTQWIKQDHISADVILQSGHHVAGFMGKKGTLYVEELSKLASEPECNSYFCRPRFIYSGGCYTVQNMFARNEVNPAAYLQRVLTHEGDRPRGELIVSALHQLSQKDPNPYAKLYPNAMNLGFNSIGPGEKSKGNAEELIRGAAKKLTQATKSKNFSEALYKQIHAIEKEEITASTSSFVALTEWWNKDGKTLSSTNAASYCPKKGTCAKHVVFENQKKEDNAKLLTDFLKLLYENDTAKNPWLSTIQPDQLVQIKGDLARVIANQDLSEEARNEIASLFVRDLRSTFDASRLIAFEVLGEIKPTDPKIHVALAEELKDSNSGIRLSAVNALGNIAPADPKIHMALAEALKDPNSIVIDNAAWSLGRIAPTDPRVHLALAAVLKDSRVQLRCAAVQAFAHIKSFDPKIHVALTEALKDFNQSVRFYAASTLGTIDPTDPKIHAALAEALEDPDRNVRLAVAKSLEIIPNLAPEALEKIKVAAKNGFQEAIDFLAERPLN